MSIKPSPWLLLFLIVPGLVVALYFFARPHPNAGYSTTPGSVHGNLHRVDFRITHVHDDEVLNRITAKIAKIKGVRKFEISRVRPHWATIIYDWDETNFILIASPLHQDEHVSFVMAGDKKIDHIPAQLNPGEGLSMPDKPAVDNKPAVDKPVEKPAPAEPTAKSSDSKPSSDTGKGSAAE